MPPKKLDSTATAAPGPSKCLTATYLRSATAGQLLGRLLEVHTALDAEQGSLPLDRSFVDELLKKEYLVSSTSDVQSVMASIIADVLRLGLSASATSLPFSIAQSADVLRLFSSSFARVRAASKPSSAHLMHTRHAMERLASSHAFVRLVSAAAATSGAGGAMDGDIEGMFQTFLHDFSATDEDAGFLSRVAIVLSDTISGTHTVTDSQLQLLLTAISPARRHANPTGALVATAVLRRHEDMLASVVASQIFSDFEAGVEEFKRVDVTDGTPTERRAALKQITNALEAMVELSKVGVGMVAQLVPQMQSFLLSDTLEVRLLAVRGFAKLFLVNVNIAGSFMPAYNLFLSRFTDQKALVKTELLKFTQSSLQASPLEGNWINLAPHLESKLVDSDEGVRRTAISVVCELAAACVTTIPAALVEMVGGRCLDKNCKVRQHACERLQQLYRGMHHHYGWIPNAVFNVLKAEGGVSSVELGLENMLPPPTKVADAADSARKIRKAKEKETAVFDFELEGDDIGGADVTGEAMQAAANKATFVDGFSKLCRDLNDDNWPLLQTLMSKKRNLRSAIEELFNRRAEVKRIGNLEDPAAKVAAQAIHRLLAFLQGISHASKGEWDNIFRAKDEKVSKAFQAACSEEASADMLTATSEFVKKLQGRLSADAQQFLEQNLVKRAFFPVSRQHINELIARITAERGLPPAKRIGSLRAAACIVAAAPATFALVLPVLVDSLSLEASRESNGSEQASSSGTKDPGSSKKLSAKASAEVAAAATETRRVEEQLHRDVLLVVLQMLASATSAGDSTAAALLQQQSKAIITSLGRICIQASDPKIAKAAALAFISLFPSNAKAQQQLWLAIHEKLKAVASGSESLIPQVASWLKTIGVMATHSNPPVIPADTLGTTVYPILYASIRSVTAEDNYDTRSKKLVPDAVAAPSISAAIVDACAKVMVRIAVNQAADRAQALIPRITSELIQAFRETRHLATGSVGACKKRMAIVQQLLSLSSRNLLDISSELTTAVIVSAEENAQVRLRLQHKLQKHIRKRKCDVRTYAMLIMTALSEETRNGYNQLRHIVHATADRLRQMQSTEQITLGDPRASQCFTEYAIPYLVLFLAHHTFFSVERDANFVGCQRVWHLLFDELFRFNTSCASFCSEMLRRLKSFDDALDVDSSATRIICDLASKVMFECLGLKSVRAETLKPYPGQTLMPRFFVKPTDPSRFPADVVYLDASVTVGSHPPFKVQTVGVVGSKSQGGTISTSQAPQGGEDDEESAAAMGTKSSPAKTPLTNTRKRARSPSAGEEEVGEESPQQSHEERVLYAALQKLCKSVPTREAFDKLGWRQVKRDLETALNGKLTEQLTIFAHETLRQLAPLA